MRNFTRKVQEFISQKQLLCPNGKYLVALSGGADSVALLLCLHELGYHVEACHCNFHLRGAESNRDEQFCIKICEQQNIPLHRIHFDTFTYAEMHKESIEMAARNLRYRYFEQLRKDVEADGICVAHHQDDSVETVIINLVRGTGLQGLKGISPKNGYILRPLLCVDRDTIMGFLKEKGQEFVTDSSNLIDDVVRNKIRLNILPLLKEINPAVCDNIAATARYVTGAVATLDAYFSKSNPEPENKLSKAWVLSQASSEYALFHALSRYGFTGKIIDDILASIHSTGKTWQSSTHRLLIDRDYIFVEAKIQNYFHTIRMPEVGKYVFCSWDGKEHRISISHFPMPNEFIPYKEKFIVSLDADKTAFPFTLRETELGDTFRPFGMKGRKLVSDFLTDKKVNLFEKERQLILEDSYGHIIWIVGRRTSEDTKVDDTTKNVLRIEIDF